MLGPQFFLILFLLAGYWLCRRNYLLKHDLKEVKESTIFISFMKRFGISLLILIVAALIVGLIVQSLGNQASSGGFAAFIIIPLALYLMRTVWKK
jgi:hypothetical protein